MQIIPCFLIQIEDPVLRGVPPLTPKIERCSAIQAGGAGGGAGGAIAPGTMGNSDHGTTYTYTASRVD